MPSASPFHTMSQDSLFGTEPQDTSLYNDPMMPAKQSYAEPAPHHSDLEPDDTNRTYATLQTPTSMQRASVASRASSSSILDLSMVRRDPESPIPSPTNGDPAFLSSIWNAGQTNGEFISDEQMEQPNWKQTPPRQWSNREVVDWVYHVVKTWGINPLHVHGEQFNELTGQDLCTMSLEDFERRDSLNGSRFYDCFQNLLNQVNFQIADFSVGPLSPANPLQESLSSSSTDTDMEMLTLEEKTILPNISHLMSNRNPVLSRESAPDNNTANLDINGTHFDYDLWDKFNDIPDSCESDNNQDSDGEHPMIHIKSEPRPSSYNTTGFRSNNTPLAVVQPISQLPTTSKQAIPSHLAVSSAHQTQAYSHSYGPPCHLQSRPVVPDVPAKRRPGRPRKNPLPGDFGQYIDGKSPSKSGRRPGSTSKGTVQLWKFVRDLLLSNEHNPRIIRWEDKDDGVFRIVCSEEVAKMWGDMKNNPSMTYEKMSRAMRFCRDQDYFAEVPKDKNFPKKLCFRFGTKATGWQ